MILNAKSIKDLGIITPHVDTYRHANGLSGGQSIASYDVHADEAFTIWPIHMAYTIDRARLFGTLQLFPNPDRPMTAKQYTREFMRLPLDVAGMFALKSTHARLFVNQSVTWTDPGFGLNAYDERGCKLVVELGNLGTEPVEFQAGSPIGQMVFMRSEPTTGYAGRYAANNGIGVK